MSNLNQSTHIRLGHWALQLFALCSIVVVILLTTSLMFGQKPVWKFTYDGPDNLEDCVNAIVYGADGNIYVAGTSRSLVTYFDFFVMSVSASGTINWRFNMNGAGSSSSAGDTSSDDCAQAIAYGPDGNIYAVGRLALSASDYAFTVLSIRPDGSLRWIYKKSGTGNGLDDARELAFDSENNIYVVGWTTDVVASCDFTIISLDQFGHERWVYNYNGSANATDLGLDIVYGADGNIYACGYTDQGQTGTDWTIISLTPGGEERWVQIDRRPGDDHCYSIVYGSDHRIYVAGETYNQNNGSSDFTIENIDPSCSRNWVYTYDFVADYDCANSIAMGPDGNIYATGWSAGSSSYDALVISLDAQGTERWVYRYDTTKTTHEGFLSEIEFDRLGNLYVGGYSCNFGSGYGCCVLASLDSRGSERWMITCCDSGYTTGFCEAIALGTDGNLYATGEAATSNWQCDIGVACITVARPGPSAPCTLPGSSNSICSEGNDIVPADFIGGPKTNPCFDRIVFDLDLPADANVKLTIYDAVGRIVDSPKSSRMSAGLHEIQWTTTSPGIYFYCLESLGHKKTGKIVVLR